MARLVRVRIDDDRLVEEAMRLGGHRTKKEMVHEVLREFIRHRPRVDVAELFGKVSFEPKEGDKKKPRRNQKKPRGPRH